MRYIVFHLIIFNQKYILYESFPSYWTDNDLQDKLIEYVDCFAFNTNSYNKNQLHDDIYRKSFWEEIDELRYIAECPCFNSNIDASILTFIRSFYFAGESIKTVFTQGRCYWFASILHERFGLPIVYNIVNNHFAAEYCGHFYDITGEIHGTDWIDWETYDDTLHKQRIIKDCIK